MKRLALAVFDIKPLQFSRENKGRARERGGGVQRKLHATLCRCSSMDKISPLFFFSQAISGFGKKWDKFLRRNESRM